MARASQARAPKVAGPSRVGGFVRTGSGGKMKVTGEDAAMHAMFRRGLSKADRKDVGASEVAKGKGGG